MWHCCRRALGRNALGGRDRKSMGRIRIMGRIKAGTGIRVFIRVFIRVRIRIRIRIRIRMRIRNRCRLGLKGV